VLTTALCFQPNLVPLAYSVVIGTHHLSNITHRMSIGRFMFHSDYNRVTSANDIGMIKLSARIPSFSPRVIPACSLRSDKQAPKSNFFIVAGWRTRHNMTSPVSETDELRQTILTGNDQCSLVYSKYNAKKQLCAGTEHSWRDLCQGDIGSGLFQKQTYDVDRWSLVGMTSYGCEHASEGYPGVYVRISAYYEWIAKAIEQMNKEN
jgi:trypsin